MFLIPYNACGCISPDVVARLPTHIFEVFLAANPLRQFAANPSVFYGRESQRQEGQQCASNPREDSTALY